MTPDQKSEFAAKIRRWQQDPRIYVREVFGVTPDPWQDDILEAFPHNQRLAMQACRGPGKTGLLAWLAWNFLSTRDHPNLAATSISGDQLRDGFMKEMSKWQSQDRSGMLKHFFEWSTTRIVYKQHPANWFLSARTWPKSGKADEQAKTLSGLHADYIMFLLDESGGMPDAIMAAAEAALSSCVEGHIVQAGNPTHLAGPLYRAATTEKDLWYRVEITADPDDPKRASRVHVDWARQQIKKYGADHPFVVVNVFGKFPPQSLTALIGPEEVREAMRRSYNEYQLTNMPKVMGIDVARQGAAQSVIARRHGLQMLPLHRYRNVANGVIGASITNRHWAEFDADACFIDGTGGYGFTWIDQLVVLGRAPIAIQFNAKPNERDRYFNRRAEMYFRFVQWIKNGGALPPEDTEGAPELMKALTETMVTFNKDQLQIEDKDDIVDKLGFSPDEADAAVLTVAEDVTPRRRNPLGGRQASAVTAYDPMADLHRISGDVPRGATSRYNPFENL